MLKGQRIILRPIKVEDTSLFFKWLNDPKIIELVGFYLPITEMQEKKWIEEQGRQHTPSEIVFVIEFISELKPIGFCSLNKINYKDRHAELTVIIGESNFWGKGLGNEIGGLIIKYAFNQLNLNRLYTGVYAFNKRSLKSIVKLGFKKEGQQRQAVFKNGAYHDNILFGLLRSEWNS
jgi:RimJ/RimL family protein N-acetyltransferase